MNVCVSVCLCVSVRFGSHSGTRETLEINSTTSNHCSHHTTITTRTDPQTGDLELSGCHGAVQSLIPLLPPLPLLLHLILGLLLAQVLLPAVFLGAELLWGLVALPLVGLGERGVLGSSREGPMLGLVVVVVIVVYLVGLWGSWGDMDQSLGLHWNAILGVEWRWVSGGHGWG